MKREFLCSLLLFAIAAMALGIISVHVRQPPRTGPQTEKRFPPLKVPPGFKATLFACDPLIEYPSVIAIGPRPGALFVAIDYMTGLGTDGKVKSEIRLVEDTDGDGYADKATVVAKGFNSIQGLAYHDGALFVMHAPFLSTVIDGKRTDLLTGLGLKPQDNPSRLHCANGVVVGHDGWLYLAFGDNGVDIQRPEGDRLVYKGGGILRCRPDGRDLHIFATGLRNIYDIALDAELNVFTRDNENDGGTYMIRVYHSFHGADHGYPYDYEERPDHTMKPIGDFGLGSSAGGICYLETQFPREYRGNLFFCEWGKSVVRYELKRVGSGFAPVKQLEFASGDPKDTYPFKPTDIVVQRDGTLMVSDYADGQRPKRGRGRIYHIAHAGQNRNKPAPDLDSESYYDRCEAQWSIERSGQMPAQNLGPRARLHYVWALARLNGARAMDGLLKLAGTDPDTSVRIQAVRAIADLTDPILVKHKLDTGRGDLNVAQRLAELGKGADPGIMLEVVIALGRLRWSEAPDWLSKNLGNPDAALAHAAMQTMRRSANWPAVLKLLDQSDDMPARTIALRALADRHEIDVVAGLVERIKAEKDPSRRREYANVLSRVYKKPGPWKYWGYRPAPRPANTQAWERTDAIGFALGLMLGDPDREVRLSVLKRMQREKVPVPLIALGDWLKDEHQPDRTAAILASLSEQPAEGVRPHLGKVVRDRRHSAANRLTALALFIKGNDKGAGSLLFELTQELEDGAVLAEALRRIAQHPQPQSASFLASKLKSADAEVRAAAIWSLGELRVNDGRERILELLQDKDVRVRRAAAGAAGKMGAKSASEPLLKLAEDADSGVRSASLDSLRQLREKRVVPLAVAALSDRALEMKALECLRELGGLEQAGAVAELAKRSPSADIVLAAAQVLTAWQDMQGMAPAQVATWHELERAIAEVHGAGGILARWRASDPMKEKDAAKVVAQVGSSGVAPPGWRTLFASGAEARILLAAKDAANDDVSFGQTDIGVSQPTAVEFLASSRGSLQVWLNGRSLYRRVRAANFQIDSDRFAGTLKKGMNRILVQTEAANGKAEFHLRFRRVSAKADHEKLSQAALTRAGNVERGRKVFFDREKSQCLKCHQLGDQGERVGPELTGVGGRFSRIYLVESILEPSRTIAPSFGTIAVTLKSGKLLNGVKVAQTEATLTLADNQGQKHILARADIQEQNESAVSTMPEGLEQRLTQEEFVDLIAFLASQKQGRKP
jgi:putative membrane-bound dehydrogenase-like protein